MWCGRKRCLLNAPKPLTSCFRDQAGRLPIENNSIWISKYQGLKVMSQLLTRQKFSMDKSVCKNFHETSLSVFHFMWCKNFYFPAKIYYKLEVVQLLIINQVLPTLHPTCTFVSLTLCSEQLQLASYEMGIEFPSSLHYRLQKGEHVKEKSIQRTQSSGSLLQYILWPVIAISALYNFSVTLKFFLIFTLFIKNKC